MSVPHAKDPPTASPAPAASGAWAPFRNRTFAVIWTATVVSNIGGWMYTVASGWLMTSLDPNPFIVFWFFTHPSISSRVSFAQSYNPWTTGNPKYVK